MIYLLRHTTPDIEPGICYGFSDIGLLESSCEAELTAAVERVKELSFSEIYSSPLKRCRLLAHRVAQGGEITFDDRAKEMNFGEWEGVTWDDIFLTPQGKAWFDNFTSTPTPSGESFEDLMVRVRSLFTDIESIEGDVLVVTHSGVIRAAMVVLGRATSGEVFDMQIEYGELIACG
ncbi:MAG: alpha-ribazole phosphatase family protein [Rikenellaceae bacterium]